MKTTVALTVTLCLLLGSLQAQNLPLLMNYQGRVTDSNSVGLGTGTPINRKVIFRIYDAAIAGNKLWSEQQTVTLSNGEFSVLLGQGIDAIYDSVTETPRPNLDTVFAGIALERYLEIVVDNGNDAFTTADSPIAPRQQVTSTAFSFRSSLADRSLRADSAASIATGSDLEINGSPNHGLGYYDVARPFNLMSVDGPVLYGAGGGALGSVNGTNQKVAMRWNSNGQVGVGDPNYQVFGETRLLSDTDPANKLVIQGSDSRAGNPLPPQQLNIRSDADPNKRLLIGVASDTGAGYLQAFSAASTPAPLRLNWSGVPTGSGPTTAAPVYVGGQLETFGGFSAQGPMVAWDGFAVQGDTRLNGNLTLQGSGAVASKPGGGSWTDSSDRRIKKNVKPLKDAVAQLTQLRGVRFEWIHPEDHADQTGAQGGFIAQEVAKAFPKWVTSVTASERDKALSDDGKILSMSLPFEFDALVVEAIKEQQQQLEAKDATIATLEGRLAALEAKEKDRDRELAVIRKLLESQVSPVSITKSSVTN